MKNTILFTLVVLSSISLFSQEENSDKKYDFFYVHLDSLKTTRLLRLDLTLLNVGIQGEHIAFSIGGTLSVQHFVDKFSFDASYFIRYGAFNWILERPGYKTQVKYDEAYDPFVFLGKEYSAHIGYTIMQNTKKSKNLVDLKRLKNKLLVANFLVNKHRILDLRIGYSYFDYPTSFEVSIPNIGTKPLYFNQNVRAFSFGVSYKRMFREKFKTDKYGEIKIEKYSEFFADLHFGLKPTMPDRLFEPVYNVDQLFYTESSPETVDLIHNSLDFRRLGVLVGHRWTPFNHGLSMALTLALRPRFIGEPNYRGLLTFGCTAAYTFMVNK